MSAIQGFTGPGGVSPATVDYQGNVNLIDAARAAGAQFVLMSVAGAAADSPMELFRMKHAAEEHLRASGASWTIVRATAFLELWIDVLDQDRCPLGPARRLRTGEQPDQLRLRHRRRRARRTRRNRPRTRGRILEIGGPDNLTFNQLAAAIQAAAGRTGTPRHVPPPVLRLMAGTVGRIKPELGRQARAALLMDRADLTHDTAGIRQACPGLPCTPLSTCLQP